VLTDYKNLTYFITTKVLNRKQVRWAKFLASYNFQIYYQKGSENEKANILSRKSDYRDGTKVKPYSIFRQNKNRFLEYNHRI
jgi:hypothetical protein